MMTKVCLSWAFILLVGCLKEIPRQKASFGLLQDKSIPENRELLAKVTINPGLSMSNLQGAAQHSLNVVRNANKAGDVTMSDVVSYHILDQVGQAPGKVPDCCDYDGDLAAIMKEFKADVDANIKDFDFEQKQQLIKKIKWVDKFSRTESNPNVVAMCNYMQIDEAKLGGGQELKKWKEIELLRSATDKFIAPDKPARLKLVLYHELFHCFFERGHLPPNVFGIMNRNISVVVKNLQQNWKQLVEDQLSPSFIENTQVLQ